SLSGKLYQEGNLEAGSLTFRVERPKVIEVIEVDLKLGPKYKWEQKISHRNHTRTITGVHQGWENVKTSRMSKYQPTDGKATEYVSVDLTIFGVSFSGSFQVTTAEQPEVEISTKAVRQWLNVETPIGLTRVYVNLVDLLYGYTDKVQEAWGDYNAEDYALRM